MTKADEPTRRGVAGPLAGGVAALVVLFVVGAAVTVPRMERSLAADARSALTTSGADADVVMSGQTATLHCPVPLADPASAKAAVAAVSGIRSVQLDPSCDTGAEPGAPDTSTPASTAPASTAPASTASNTTVAPSTSTVPSTQAVTTTTIATVPPTVSVRLADGRLTLVGKVQSPKQRDVIAYVVGHAVADGNMIVQLTVDPAVAVDDALLGRLGTVALAMPVNLVSGSVGIEGEALHAVGVFADDAHRAEFERVAKGAGARSELVLRPTGTAADATKVQQRMNDLVAVSPIVYKKGATDIAPESQAVIEQLVGMAKQFGGLHIEVQGHTDSEGDPGRNLLLSQRRAQAALDAMVALGVPAGDLSAKGFGETQLIVDQNGKEIPAKSRRVVFGVSAR